MRRLESGGALAVRRATKLWPKLAAAIFVTLSALTISPALAVYLLLVN